MSCKNVLYLTGMLVLAPAWIGILWVEFLNVKGKADRLLHAWILGFATMLAIAQLVFVPLVALQQTLTTATMIWKTVMQILAVAAFLLVLRRQANRWRQTAEISECNAPGKREEKSDRRWVLTFGILAAVLILIQAYIPARYEHSDDDDSRFIAEEVSAVEHDTMYQESPIRAEYLYWNEGEVRKDLTSPWAMFVAMQAKLGDMAPAEYSHAHLPFFLILICYALYLLIGRELFHGDWEKTFLFLIILSVIHLAGYTSTHTLASMLLLRIWQGKAVCASFSVPLLFYLFYRIMKREYDKRWIPVLYVASTGACLLSGIGIVTAPIVLFLYGVLDFCYYRKWRKTFVIWMAALPCAIFLGYYLM